MSLALGAFIAGLVVSDSPFSHQVSADLLPFREAFVQRIVRPELEGGVELLRQTLQDLSFTDAETGSLIELARQEAMGIDPHLR